MTAVPVDAAGGRRLGRGALGVALALCIAAAAWAVFSTGLGRDPRDVPSGLVGRPAPALRGSTLAGGTLDLAALRGKVVLVNVWAAWCGPCRDELPLLTAAERALGGRGLRVVGIDTRDGARQAKSLLATSGGDPTMSVVDPVGGVAVDWGVLGVPETFLVDADGVVQGRQVGPLTSSWIDRNVVPLLSP